MVEATDQEGSCQRLLSPRFQELIDGVAMRLGQTDAEAYLAGWAQGPEAERPGPARQVAEQVAAELENGFAELAARSLTGRPGEGAPEPDP
jgi:hypothetical protein